MASDWLNHKLLLLVKGIGKTPSDTVSNEINPVTFNLMAGAVSLDADGWTPNIPATKGGGIWIESPITDGRQLLTAPLTNVIEKIGITISDSTYLETAKKLEALNHMAKDCRNYWEDKNQYDPVYLMWQANCAPGAQYALLYNIELSPSYEQGIQPTIKVAISLEREVAWRGIPPGANPRIWTLYKASKSINTSNASLITQTDDLIYDTNVKNRFEWDTSYVAPVSRNYIDIPASTVDGDAPALVSLVMQGTTNAVNPPSSFYVGKSTRPTSLKDRNGNIMYQSAVFNAGDAVAPTNWTKTIDATCGCLSNGSAVNRYIGRNAALANGTYNQFVTWGFFNSNNFVNFNLLGGTYAIFWRCKQLNGASGDIQARFRLTDNVTTILGDYQNLPLIAAAGATCENRFDMLYLGRISLPFANQVIASSDGRGITTQQKNLNVGTAAILVDVLQNNVANRSIDFLDLILMPLNEQMVNLLPNAGAGGSFAFFGYDNTGYFSHGDTLAQAKLLGWDGSISSIEAVMEARGQELTLTPGVNNRLYFIYQRAPAIGGTPNFSAADSSNDFASIRINIVPRWYGIRDV